MTHPLAQVVNRRHRGKLEATHRVSRPKVILGLAKRAILGAENAEEESRDKDDTGYSEDEHLTG